MKTSFIPQLQRYPVTDEEVAYEEVYDAPVAYDGNSYSDYETEEDILYGYGEVDPSYNFDWNNEPVIRKTTVEPSTNWLGSIHQLTQDATAIIYATKGVPTMQTQQGAQPVYMAAQNGQVLKRNADGSYEPASNTKTGTIIAIAIIAVLLIVGIILILKGKK